MLFGDIEFEFVEDAVVDGGNDTVNGDVLVVLALVNVEDVEADAVTEANVTTTDEFIELLLLNAVGKGELLVEDEPDFGDDDDEEDNVDEDEDDDGEVGEDDEAAPADDTTIPTCPTNVWLVADDGGNVSYFNEKINKIIINLELN